jgi:hypothetical protein
MILDSTLDEKKGIPTRYLILLMIFIVTAVNYGDRATLSPVLKSRKSWGSARCRWDTFFPPSAGLIC